ncbi:hypothetical protein PHMEG_0007840 [Phytophthora megakarya]|uniref:MULE transposase domain-containing protein n=1 Tax=Phytophthora megakarya TaxID=4795 RepID=A0A225WKF9_9STRA|nr:hypothetical protein PHMEG_0007840 [Phytophthora megakarya]
MPSIGTRPNRREERTTCYYRGYKHTKAWGSSRKIVYRCSQFRKGCRGTIEYTIATMGYSSVRPHTCSNAVVASGVIDALEVMMVHDLASGVFVPVYYVLGTARDESAYWNMIHFVPQGTDRQLQPAEIICDSEDALQNAIQTQFPNTIVVGCLFHMKQAYTNSQYAALNFSLFVLLRPFWLRPSS